MNQKLSKAIDLGRADQARQRALDAERAEEEQRRVREAREAREAVVQQYVLWLKECDLLYERVRKAVSDGRDSFLLFRDDLPDPSLDHLTQLADAVGRIDGFRGRYEPDDAAEGGPPVHAVRVSWSY